MGKIYDFLIWFLPRLGDIPKAFRYHLGSRLQDHLYASLEMLLEASYTGDPVAKRETLLVVNRRLDFLRYEIRACRDLGFLTPERHEHSMRSIDEVGRLVGGVLRSVKA